MAIKILTGGTTGAADGTLVSVSNRLTFTSTTAIDAHIRCDDGYWSNDQLFDLLPDTIEVSFDGGSTWYGPEDEPITAPEIYAVNYPIKLRQPTAVDPGSTASSFDTDGSYTAIAALSTPTLTATVVDGDQIDLSWTDVSNEDGSPGYTIERSLNGSSWSALTTKAANVTTHSDTGLTEGTRYYYRVRAEGSGRFSDSGWGTDDAVVPLTPGYAAYALTSTSGGPINSVEGPDGNMWVVLNGVSKILRITPDGATKDEFACPDGVTGPQDICVLGGNIWYTGATSGHVVKISTFSGTPTQTAYSVTAAYGICAGPDGNLWVTSNGTAVRKVNPADGSVTSTYNAASGSLRFITTDGTDLFATNYDYSTTGGISRITTGGSITTTASPDSGAAPLGICWDATSSFLYIAGLGSGKIYKVTAGATQTWTGYTIHASAQPADVCVGPDGRIYSMGYNASYKNLYSMPAGGGSFTTETAVGAGAGAWGLTTDSRGIIWLCENISGAAKFSRFVP